MGDALIQYGIVGFLGLIAMKNTVDLIKWIIEQYNKKNNNQDTAKAGGIYLCPLDREGAIKALENVENKMGQVLETTRIQHKDIESIAENLESQGKALAQLLHVHKNVEDAIATAKTIRETQKEHSTKLDWIHDAKLLDGKVLADILEATKEQNKILNKIAKNGSA